MMEDRPSSDEWARDGDASRRRARASGATSRGDANARGTSRRTMASSGGVNPRALAEAQRADEMFEVMRPPPSDGFDVDRDRPTPTGERKARGLVHADGDWHRSAHVWLVDARRGRLAMQRRSAKKDTFPNRWDISAAGHVSVDDDGDSRKTAVNELAEELGVELDDPRELEFQFTCPAEMAPLGGCNCFEDVYFLPWNVDSNGDAFAVGEAEVTATKWIDIDHLRRALEDDDDSYVPRTATYRAHFFDRLARFAARRRARDTA